MPSSTIYHLHPLLVGSLTGWDAELDRIAALGIGAVAIPPPFAASRSGHLQQVADHDRPHPILESGQDGTATLALLASLCRERGLSLILDLVPDRVAAGGALAAAHPDWLRGGGSSGAALDPRREPEEADTAGLDLALEPVLDWWAKRLRVWAQAGVAGYRCLAPARTPSDAWRHLIAAARAANPDTTFLAWTAGLPRGALPGLAGLGFDRTAASSAWWDFRAGWLLEERTALDAVAPPIAFPEAPFGQRFAADAHDPAQRERAARRALLFAAGYGAGLLIPMGFEYGARRPLDIARDRPGDWTWLRERAPYDLSDSVREAAAIAEAMVPVAKGDLRPLSGPGAPVVALMRADSVDPRSAETGALVLANADLAAAATVAPGAMLAGAGGTLTRFADQDGNAFGPDTAMVLAPGEVRVLNALPGEKVRLGSATMPDAQVAGDWGRVAVEAVTPLVDGGRFPVKRTVGEAVTVEADVFTDGHGKLGVALLWRPADENTWRERRMEALGNDRWRAVFPLERLGRYEFAVEGWTDVFATYHDELSKKHAAGLDVTLELEEGVRLVVAAAARASTATAGLAALAERLRGAAVAERLSALLSPDTVALMTEADDRPHRERQDPVGTVEAERLAARFASWYELFPRSQSGDGRRHGTFLDVIPQLPRIRDMGFDVLYFTPIHPIGRKNRKGPNNTLTPGPEDVGSPYAIGSSNGGHEALHPELGTLEDFHRLRDAARDHGLELAMDFAIQCAPDHPWLREHPDWFDWRPDGTIKYAENPPKKYQDIVNVDFYAKGARPGLWTALRDVIEYWVEQGVKTFRVDNPHTKPLPFWEWMIGDIRSRHPEAIFLSEAFTRPKVMYRLAKVGFSQSYTYFTWRNTKREMQEYLTELNTTAPRDFFRPHFFVNTPDINPTFLQTSGRAGHLIRAALASTLSGLWGVYNGFELCEATPLAPGKEEYLDSEKFQLKAWDYQRPGNIIAEITRLNHIRRDNPALHSHLGVTFQNAFHDDVLFYSKSTADRSNVILAAVSMNPREAVSCSYELPLWEFGLPDDGMLEVEDLMRGHRFTLRGKTQTLRLDPADLPFVLWRVRAAGA